GARDSTHRDIVVLILLSNLVNAVLQREDISESERRPFCIFVDEFQRFASSEDFEVLFTQGRKFAVATTVAHQNRFGQFAGNIRIAGATLTALTRVCFRVIDPDAKEVASKFAKDSPT